MTLESTRDYPRMVATAIMGLFLTAVVVFALILLTGYRIGCRGTDDDILIQKALEHFVALQNSENNAFRRYNLFSPGHAPSDGNYLVPISADEFRAENPDCCRFSYRGADGWLPNWRKRTLTNYKGVVTISYKLRRVENSGVVETYHQAEIPMNSCAKPIPLSKLRLGRFE